jgi:tripartite-type tricarboxylate transporter receptor subunit TctC
MLASIAAHAASGTYPDHPIKIVVPLAPGGGTDLFGRLLAVQLPQRLGQTVYVENKAGGGTIIGASSVARAAPDGYTLLLSSSTTYALNPSLYQNLSYSPSKDFAPISLTGRFALVLVSAADVRASNLRELVELARTQPMNYASPGVGSPHQLAMELFKMRADFNAMHVPYKGAAPALQDVLAGRVPLMFIDYATGAPYLKAGSLKALAVASDSRLPLLPNVPTIAESGYSGYEASAWQGLVAPAGTPDAVIRKLNETVVNILNGAEFRKQLTDLGITPLASTPEQFATYARSETVKWGDVIRHAHIVMD